jgi:hypothetical protein
MTIQPMEHYKRKRNGEPLHRNTHSHAIKRTIIVNATP